MGLRVDRNRPGTGQSRPKLVERGPTLATLAPTWSKARQIWPRSFKFGQGGRDNPDKHGGTLIYRSRLNLVELAPQFANSPRFGARIGHRKYSGRNRAITGRDRPRLVETMSRLERPEHGCGWGANSGPLGGNPGAQLEVSSLGVTGGWLSRGCL